MPVSVRASGRGFDLSGADCNDGEPYRYSDVSLEGRTLRFKLHVKSTDRMLIYELTLSQSGELVGPVTGGAEATVTWRRAEP
jgi:hypothetical protein